MSLTLVSDCFDNVIGLTRSECECVDVDPNTSLSDLWIDELEGLNLKSLDAAADCSSGSLMDLMKKAREQAIIAFKADYASNIGTNWKYIRPQSQCQIGKGSATSNFAIGNFAGHRYAFAPVRNGYWKITRIGLYFNTTGTVDIEIYNNIDQAALYSYSNVPTQADQVKWFTLPKPIYLPMYSRDVDILNYFIVYANPGFNPKKNIFRCCGMTLNFDCSSPQIDIKENDARYAYKKWCNVTGINGASIAALQAANPGFTDNAMGLIIDGVMSCDSQSIACNDGDFQHSSIPKVMAYAIWYRTGVFLINDILSSNNVNRYTMIDREALYGKRANYTKEYNNRLIWLTNPEVDEVKTYLLQSGCLECLNRMRKTSLL